VLLGQVVLLAVGLLSIPPCVGHARVGIGLLPGDGFGPRLYASRPSRQATPASARRVLRGAVLAGHVGRRAVGGALPEPACTVEGVGRFPHPLLRIGVLLGESARIGVGLLCFLRIPSRLRGGDDEVLFDP
jgi:hypothetical protein